MKITVSTEISAPITEVWKRYTSPEDIKTWNAASADWHTTASTVDLKVGGKFCSRMEAKDGSFGFDFEGVYTAIDEPNLIEYEFGGRNCRVEFLEGNNGVTVTVTCDAEDTHSEDEQREGWQSILDNFCRYVTACQNKLQTPPAS